MSEFAYREVLNSDKKANQYTATTLMVFCQLYWPTSKLFFQFCMHIFIDNFLLNREITLFLVCELLFTRKFTFYILANLNLIYRPAYYMYLFLYVPFSFLRCFHYWKPRLTKPVLWRHKKVVLLCSVKSNKTTIQKTGQIGCYVNKTSLIPNIPIHTPLLQVYTTA